MEQKEQTAQRTAFLAIVGRSNVGKSSLLNTMLGHKIAIVSRKPQTTRTKITGILTDGPMQLVFIDTPGLHKPRSSLGEHMVKSVTQSVAGVDACLLVVEAGEPISHADRDLMDRFKALSLPAVLAINKIDLLKEKEALMAQIAAYNAIFAFEAVVPVSAKNRSGVPELIAELEKFAEPSIHFFADTILTDQPDQVFASEIIREKLLRLLDKEVPHGVAVVIEKMRERDAGGVLDIEATIFCERANHKGIMIGKGGETLKKVGSLARVELEQFFGCKVYLQLWVKVKEDWRNRASLLNRFGYHNNG